MPLRAINSVILYWSRVSPTLTSRTVYPPDPAGYRARTLSLALKSGQRPIRSSARSRARQPGGAKSALAEPLRAIRQAAVTLSAAPRELASFISLRHASEGERPRDS